MRKIIQKIDLELIISVLLFSLAFICAFNITVAFGDTTVAQPAEVPVVGAGVLDWLRANSPVAPEWLIVLAGVLVEIIGRIFQTNKPWSILYFLRDFCVYVGMAFGAVGSISDKVIQRTKVPGSENPPPKI